MTSAVVDTLITLNCKKSVCSIFNQCVLNLLSDLESCCSTAEYIKIKTIKSAFVMLKLDDTSYIVDEYIIFMNDNSQHDLEKYITNKDDTLIRNIDSLKISNTNKSIFNILKNIWTDISDEFKATIWEYLELMFILCSKYKNLTSS